MKTQKNAELVLGMFRKTTTIGKLADTLKDGKNHKFSTVLTSMKGKVKNPKYRVQILREKGKKARAFRVEIDRKKDLIRLVRGAIAKKVVARKKTVTPPQTATVAA
jgi:hypothetical protein